MYMSKTDILNKKSLTEQLLKVNKQVDEEVLEKALDTVFNEISTALVCGDRVELRGFGSLVVRKRAKGKVRNPKNGEVLEASDRGSLYFRASRDLIKNINE